jgi:multimeric flavodoxin WrbA
MIAGCFAPFWVWVEIILGSELSMMSRKFDVVEVLVLYYSRTGRTEALAKAIAGGVESVEGASAKIKRVDYATVNDFISSDAVAFGSPNYFSYMAGVMKDFFDKALSIRERVAGKPSVAFTSGGGSSNSALLSLERMISSFRLEKVADGVVSQGEPSEENLKACKKLGETLARRALGRAEVPKG